MALAAVLACSACLVPEQYGGGKQEQAPESQGLIQPMIPDDAPASTSSPPEETVKQAEQVKPSAETVQPIKPPDVSPPKIPQGIEKPVQPGPTKSDRVSPAEHKEERWDDQKVKDAALRLAKRFPATQKIKICYATKDDEWWVIFYEDAGSYYELRQFVWDRDTDKLQPFLVLKRIDRHELNEHVAAAEPDRACESMDPPPRAAGEENRPLEF